MTIRTQYSKVAEIIVISIFINMMNSKNSRNFIVSTLMTLFNKTSSKHILSNGCETTFPYQMTRFAITFFRTKFSIFTWRIVKFFMTVMTSVLNRTSTNLRSVITFSRAIFSFINSSSDKTKYCLANITFFFELLMRGFSSASCGTIFCYSNAIRFNFKSFAANNAMYLNHGELYAS